VPYLLLSLCRASDDRVQEVMIILKYFRDKLFYLLSDQNLFRDMERQNEDVKKLDFDSDNE
jgi:hypothetical protein